jgi:hypothetical protein
MLLVAVCEQSLLDLAALEPPGDDDLMRSLECTRDLATADLRFGRFSVLSG